MPPKYGAFKPSGKAMRAPVETEAERSKRRYTEQPKRKWYWSKRWRELRRVVGARDHMICQMTGVPLIHGRDHPNSMVIHHIEPHHWNPDLFWDIDNCLAVAKEWHDKEAQAEERLGQIAFEARQAKQRRWGGG